MECLYRSKQAQVWQGDAQAMRWPADIDLLLTDPPYGKPYRSSRGSAQETIDGDADQAAIDRILEATWRRIRPHRHAYVFGPERPALGSMHLLTWDKDYMAGGDTEQVWGSSTEPIGFYVHRYSSEPITLPTRLRRRSVVKATPPRGKRRRAHPNYKPVALLRQLIEASTVQGDLVVDPFCGSGSTGVAALLLGRRFLGVEIDPVYARRAVEAVREADRIARDLAKLWP